MDRERALITAPWCHQDLFFLQDTLRRGASFSEVAGSLCRHEGEVREKPNELGLQSRSRVRHGQSGLPLVDARGVSKTPRNIGRQTPAPADIPPHS